MKISAVLAFVLFLGTLITGCSTHSGGRVALGMNRQQIRASLGAPQRRLRVRHPRIGSQEIWVYKGGRRMLYLSGDGKLEWLQ